MTLRVPCGDLQLEAAFTAGTGNLSAVIAPPHPLYGGTLGNPVVVAIAEGLERLGASTLRFNFRGTEASEGEASDDLQAAVEDYQAARAALRTRTQAPCVLAGYSFGAGTALLAARDESDVRGLLLLSPPVGMLLPADLAALEVPLSIIVGDHDDYAPLPALQALLAPHAHCTLEVIPGADHFFHYGGLATLGDRIRAHVQGWV